MVEMKTSRERREEKKRKTQERDEAIISRFEELREEYNVTDAISLVANEYNLTPNTIYNIRKKYNGMRVS